MPPELPCKDVWAVYRTAVLGYDLTKQPGCDKMGVSRERIENTLKPIEGNRPAFCHCDSFPRQVESVTTGGALAFNGGDDEL